MKKILSFIFLFTLNFQLLQAQQWTPEKANQWYAQQGWLVGCNFIPSTAINQLEMWQRETFDPKTIDREMDYAQGIGMNCMRVFLHDLAYQADPTGLKQRMDTVLQMADKHGIKIAFVFFDDCWGEHPKIGLQPAPIPGVHNSGWMQSPGKAIVNDSTDWERLHLYVKDILTTFADDKRILAWDLYNEPGNSNEGAHTLPLLTKIFAWAREIKLSQPITSGIYSSFKPIVNLQAANSDVITFHDYADATHLKKRIQELKKYGHPVICTEWMARTRKSICQTHLPIFKAEHVGCLNWGLVSGKTNTIYPWGSPTSQNPPKIWFHDLFHPDGTSYIEEETNTFKKYAFNTNAPVVLKKENFETTVDGKKTSLYILKNKNGMEAAITNYGGKVVSLLTPDKDGKLADVVLGFASIQDYLKAKGPYFGALIGRYGNRIANGHFALNGETYHLAKNNADNGLHGGLKGFNAVVWDARQINDQTLELSYLSKDGEEGYPGNLTVKVIYEVTNDNELKITYTASTDKTTIINLTHHSFFNLQGQGNGNVINHTLTINADKYTPVAKGLIPTGELAPVEGTPFDFRKPKAIQHDLYVVNEQLAYGSGYDHNFVLNRKPADTAVGFAARIVDPFSGRTMEVWTNEPGLQFYGGNFLSGQDRGITGHPYYFRSAFCLETQHFPDSPNHPQFPSTVLQPGQTYHSVCIYKFSVQK